MASRKHGRQNEGLLPQSKRLCLSTVVQHSKEEPETVEQPLSTISPPPTFSARKVIVQEHGSQSEGEDGDSGGDRTTMLPQQHSKGSDKTPEAPSDSINLSEKTKTLSKGETVQETNVLIKGRGETTGSFLGRVGKALENVDMELLAVTSDQIMEAPISSENYDAFIDATYEEAEASLVDDDVEYDTDDVESGRVKLEVVQQPQATRRRLFRNWILSEAASRGIVRGKWIFFTPSHRARALFGALIKEFEVTPAAFVELKYATREAASAICVWTQDFRDKAAIEEVFWRVRGVDSSLSKAFYKPEAFSLLHLRSRNVWGVRVSVYKGSQMSRTLSFR